jgi:hypothetical protein
VRHFSGTAEMSLIVKGDQMAQMAHGGQVDHRFF